MSALQSRVEYHHCPNADTLQAYTMGKLSALEISTVADHLEICHNCMDSLQSLDLVKDELISHLRHQPPKDDAALQNDAHLKEKLESISSWGLASSYSVSESEIPSQIGPYEILETLGEGGMGRVFKARHRHLGKIIALKLISPARVRSPEAIERFVHEMKAVGRLNHPNIVQAYDAEVDDVPYLAMECIDGMDLARLVKRRGPLAVADACACIRQIASALAYVNQFGLVHRDIKPSNVMLTPEGEAKLLDMGLARLNEEFVEPPIDSGNSNDRPKIVGTVQYMAPEQLLNSQGVDIRGDLYGLGCTLFHLLTGRPPFVFDADNPKALTQGHLLRPVPDLRAFRDDIPDGLIEVVERLLAKDPVDRYDKPEQLLQALAPFTSGCYLPGLIGKSSDSPSCELVRDDYSASPLRLHKPKVGWTALVLVLLIVAAVSFWALSVFRPASPPLIRSITLEVEKSDLQDGVIRQVINEDTTLKIVEDDGIRFVATFSKKAYCYVIGIEPNGKSFLCYPDTESQPPRARTEIVFPEEGAFRLSKGFGTYAFFVLASPKKLPDYAAWKAANGFESNQSIQAKHIWICEDQKYMMMSSDRSHKKLRVPVLFKSLCQYFRQCSGIETIHAVVVPALNSSSLEKTMPTP